MSTPTAPNRRNWPLILSMVAVVAAVHVLSVLPLKPPVLMENRVLASAPGIPRSWSDWAELSNRLDAFAIDRFPLRPYMIGGLNFLRYELGYSGSKKVIVGRDGWLFYDDTSHLARVAGVERLDAAGVNNWVQGLKQRVDYLSRRNTPFYVLLGPTKEDMYPEHRPGFLPRERIPTEFDDMVSKAHASGFTQVVDPRAEILAAKPARLYDEFDTHWTALGAYIGYRALMSRIAQDDPAMAPRSMSDFRSKVVTGAKAPRDMAFMLGIADFVKQEGRATFAGEWPIHDPKRTTFLGPRKDVNAPQVLHTDATSGKTVLLFRDSFSLELLPLFKEHFSTIVVTHVEDGWFRPELVERFKPDMVLLVVMANSARFSMNALPALDEDTLRLAPGKSAPR